MKILKNSIALVVAVCVATSGAWANTTANATVSFYVSTSNLGGYESYGSAFSTYAITGSQSHITVRANNTSYVFPYTAYNEQYGPNYYHDWVSDAWQAHSWWAGTGSAYAEAYFNSGGDLTSSSFSAYGIAVNPTGTSTETNLERRSFVINTSVEKIGFSLSPQSSAEVFISADVITRGEGKSATPYANYGVYDFVYGFLDISATTFGGENFTASKTSFITQAPNVGASLLDGQYDLDADGKFYAKINGLNKVIITNSSDDWLYGSLDARFDLYGATVDYLGVPSAVPEANAFALLMAGLLALGFNKRITRRSREA